MRAMVPEFVTVDTWSVLVVNVIVVAEAVTPHVPVVTDSCPTDVAAPLRPAAPASGGTRATPSSRTAARAAVLHAVRCVKRFIRCVSDYWLVTTPVRCCSVNVKVSAAVSPWIVDPGATPFVEVSVPTRPRLNCTWAS